MGKESGRETGDAEAILDTQFYYCWKSLAKGRDCLGLFILKTLFFR